MEVDGEGEGKGEVEKGGEEKGQKKEGKEEKEEGKEEKKEGKEGKDEKEEEEEKEEETGFTVPNMGRVTLGQARHMSFPESCRWKPVRDMQLPGFVMLRDTDPGTPCAFLDREVAAKKKEGEGSGEDKGKVSGSRREWRGQGQGEVGV